MGVYLWGRPWGMHVIGGMAGAFFLMRRVRIGCAVFLLDGTMVALPLERRRKRRMGTRTVLRAPAICMCAQIRMLAPDAPPRFISAACRTVLAP